MLVAAPLDIDDLATIRSALERRQLNLEHEQEQEQEQHLVERRRWHF